MAQPGCDEIRVGVRDGILDVIRPVQKSALVRDVESGVGGRRGDASGTRGNEIFVALLFVNLQFYFGPVLEDSRKGAVITQPFTCCDFYGQISFAEALVARWSLFRPRDCIYVITCSIYTRKIYYQLGRQLLPPDHKQKPSSAGAAVAFELRLISPENDAKKVQPVSCLTVSLSP